MSVIIDYNNIKENYLYLKKKYNKKIYAVLKSNAYNHDLFKTCKVLYEVGCKDFCIIDYKDIDVIKKVSNKINILFLNKFNYNKKIIKDMINKKITFSVDSFDDIYYLNKYKNKKEKVKIQIELKSRMNRFGIDIKYLNKYINLIKEFECFEITGIYSHLASSYYNNINIYNIELLSIYNYKDDFLKNIDIHIASSEGNKNEKNISNSIRIGIDLYRYKPTMYVYGGIIKIVKIKKGESVSYINDYKADEDLLIGICDLGYYNGIIKRYKGNEVYINNSKYTIVGNICMNNCFIKIDDKIKLNDKVEFLGDNILLENIAFKNNISMHEILLSMK